MRAVVQRVSRASVEVEGEVVADIGQGLLVLLGIHKDDTDEASDYIINKVLGLRVFDDDQGVMNRSVEDIQGSILVISQFTLYGDVRRGRRPSYSDAMGPDRARDFYDRFLSLLKSRFSSVVSGSFGAHMNVSLVNSGPVTILLDSTRLF